MGKYLRSNFKIGFEFEGFARVNTYFPDEQCDYDDYACNPLQGDKENKALFFNAITTYINNQLGVKSGKTHHDGSLKNYLDGYQSFEYSSNIFRVNARNLYNLNKFFNNLEKHDMGVNETCGFHTHISFDGITEKDAQWIVCQIAFNDDWSKEFTQFNYNDNLIDFFSEYANNGFLKNIKNAILDNDFLTLSNNLNSEKYRCIRVHPQGTLEWRGPRNFLDKKDGFRQYSYKLIHIIDIMIQALNNNTLNGINKEDFFDKITIFRNINRQIDYNTYIGFRRKNIIGTLDCFGNESTSDIHVLIHRVYDKLSYKIKDNPFIMLNKNIDSFLPKLLQQLDFDWSLIILGKIYKDKRFISKPNIIRQLLLNNPSIIDEIDKSIFQHLSYSDILLIIDKYISKKIINPLLPATIVNNYSHNNIAGICKALLNAKNKYAYNAVKDAVYRNSLNGINIYELSEKIHTNYSDIIYNDFMNTVKPYIDKGLISYEITVNNDFHYIQSLLDQLIVPYSLDINRPELPEFRECCDNSEEVCYGFSSSDAINEPINHGISFRNISSNNWSGYEEENF